MTFFSPGELWRYNNFQRLCPSGCAESDCSSLAKFILRASVFPHNSLHCFFLWWEIANWRTLKKQHAVIFVFIYFVHFGSNKGQHIIVHQTTKIQSDIEYIACSSCKHCCHLSTGCAYQCQICSTKFENCIVPFEKNDLIFVVHHKCFAVFLSSSLLYSIEDKDVKSVRLDVSCHHWMLLWYTLLIIM